MPDAVFLGPLALPPLGLAGLLTLVTTGLFLSLVLKPRVDAEAAHWIASRGTNALLIALLIWKLWPLWRWWEAILQQPLILLRLPGGPAGLTVAATVGFLYFLFPLYRRRDRLLPVVYTIAVAGISFLFVLAAIPGFSTLPDSPQPGSRFLDFPRDAFLGTTLPNSDDRDMPTVITFWATWCGPCVAELPVKAQFYQENRHRMRYVAVNLFGTETSREAVRRFVDRHHMDYPVFLDENGEYARAFAVRGTPSTVVLDREGNVVARWMGPSSFSRLERSLLRAMP